jgi:hypothetical protein
MLSSFAMLTQRQAHKVTGAAETDIVTAQIRHDRVAFDHILVN